MAQPQSAAQQARNRLGGIRSKIADPEAAEAARRDLAEAKLDARVREIVDAAPLLTPAQRRELALAIGAGDGAT